MANDTHTHKGCYSEAGTGRTSDKHDCNRNFYSILHSLEVRIQKSTGRVESWRPFIVIGPLIRRGLDTDISLLLGSVNNIVRIQVKETGTEIPEQNQKFF